MMIRHKREAITIPELCKMSIKFPAVAQGIFNSDSLLEALNLLTPKSYFEEKKAKGTKDKATIKDRAARVVRELTPWKEYFRNREEHNDGWNTFIDRFIDGMKDSCKCRGAEGELKKLKL